MKKSHSRITFKDGRGRGDGKFWFHNCSRNQIKLEMTMNFYIDEKDKERARLGQGGEDASAGEGVRRGWRGREKRNQMF